MDRDWLGCWVLWAVLGGQRGPLRSGRQRRRPSVKLHADIHVPIVRRDIGSDRNGYAGLQHGVRWHVVGWRGVGCARVACAWPALAWRVAFPRMASAGTASAGVAWHVLVWPALGCTGVAWRVYCFQLHDQNDVVHRVEVCGMVNAAMFAFLFLGAASLVAAKKS